MNSDEKRTSSAKLRRKAKSSTKRVSSSPVLEDTPVPSKRPKTTDNHALGLFSAQSDVEVSNTEADSEADDKHDEVEVLKQTSKPRIKSETSIDLTSLPEVRRETQASSTSVLIDQRAANYQAMYRDQEQDRLNQLATEYQAKWLALELKSAFDVMAEEYQRQWLEQ